MRKIANVNILNSNAVRLMIFDKEKDGVFVFGYSSEKDSSCSWDCHYNTIEEAYEMGNDYGIQKEDWETIPDPLKHCQDDWIAPVRVKGRIYGHTEWGTLEKLVDGQWVKLID